jgi:hypothetical protein
MFILHTSSFFILVYSLYQSILYIIPRVNESMRPISVSRLKLRRPLIEASNFRFIGIISRPHSSSLEDSSPYNRSLLRYSYTYNSRSSSLIPRAL